MNTRAYPHRALSLRTTLWLAVLQLLFALAPCQATENILPALPLDRGSNQIRLSPLCDWLMDPGGQLTLEQAVQSKDWQTANGRNPNFGVSDQVYWFKVAVRNHDSVAIDKVIEISSILPRSVDVYMIHDDGRVDTIGQAMGLDSHFSNRPIQYPRLLHVLALDPGEAVTLVYRFRALGASEWLLNLYEHTLYGGRQHKVVQLFGITYGVYGIAIMLSLVLYSMTRERMHAYFSACCFSLITLMVMQNGDLYSWFPNSGKMVRLLFYLMSPLYGLTLTLFTLRFNRANTLVPVVNRWLLILSLLSSALLFAGHMVHSHQLLTVAALLLIGVLLGLFVTSIICWRKGNNLSLYALVATSILLLCISSEILRATGFISSSLKNMSVVYLGNVAMVIVYATGIVALNNRIRQQAMHRALREERDKRKLEKASIDAQRTNQFLANMSHEIRTPINGILGMAEILADTDLDKKQRHYNSIVLHSARTLLNVVNDILDFSKIRNDKLTLENSSFSLSELYSTTYRNYATLAEGKGIKMAGDFDVRLPLYVIGDAARIQQILNNLLSNALKFTDSGKIDFKVGLKHRTATDCEICFIVRDTGIGMNEDQLQRLYDAFEQADVSTSRRYGGTGLGMAITQQLVQLMGGSIGVKSEPDQGSEFSITIPLRIDTEKEARREQEFSILKDKHMLLLDSSEFLKPIANWFERNGMRVTPSSAIKDAIAAAQEKSSAVDLIAVSLVDAKLARDPELQKLLELDIPVMAIPAANEELLSKAIKDRLLMADYKASGEQLLRTCIQALTGIEASSQQAADNTAVPEFFSRLKLLVAEDNLINQQVISTMLNRMGVEHIIAADGQQTYASYLEHRDSLSGIFMDCEMPVCDGFEATRMIRAHEREQQLDPIPIVALTAHALPEYKQRCRDCGMNDIIVKPVGVSDIRATVEKWFA